jgi:hypothetical protein
VPVSSPRSPGAEAEAAASDESLQLRRDTLNPPQRQLNQRHTKAPNGRTSLGALDSRAGEITQLRGHDVIERDGIKALRITPDAGTVKTKEVRIVPIHDHLIEIGFLKYVSIGGSGPLFYDPTSPDTTDTDTTNPNVHGL